MIRGKIVEGTDFLVKPEHINTKQHFFEAFGHAEPEISARRIVLLCQQLGSWGPFTHDQLMTLGSQKYNHGKFSFCGLDEEGWIVKDDEGNYRVTDAFIRACYKSSPADGA